jgi:ABC-2 type transport system ATP-binding protein
MTIFQNLRILGTLYDLDTNQITNRVIELSQVLKLDNYLNKLPGDLSLGERMKCEIAATIFHNPKLVLLDEPTIGLDIINKKQFRDYLKEINKYFGTTILLSSHDLYDIQAVCSRIIIFNQGRALFDDQIGALNKNIADKKIFKISSSDDPIDLGKFSAFKLVSAREQSLEIEVSKTEEFYQLVDLIKSLDLDFSIERPSLEQLVREFYD